MKSEEDKMSVNLSDATRDFLLYSYFGITAEDLNDTDKIITICAQRAYLDLNRTLMFKLEFKDSTTNDTKAKHDRTKERKKFRDQMCDIIKKNVCSLMKSNSHEDYDKKHSDLCKTLQEEAKKYCEYEVNKDKKDGITYGQAQKWLNMTVKYMWLLGIWYDKFDKIHVPVDSYIIEAVKRKLTLKTE